MGQQLRVEIAARNEFWRRAVMVEWEAQFPDRPLIAAAGGYYLIAAEWLEDLQRVASQCLSQVVLAPEEPERRRWLRRFFPRGDQA
jgi:hypothetical protein